MGANDPILVKIEEDEFAKEKKMKTSQYIGVSYCETNSGWGARRWSKNEKKPVYNGFYKSEETAAYASDTLARKFMKNGEQDHKLNFPDDDTEVNAEKKPTASQYIGVTYSDYSTWRAYRWSKYEKRKVYNGNYKDEKTAAHASDTLARKLMQNGEQKLKLNFPNDDTEVYPEKKHTSSVYIGVSYSERKSIWLAYRRSRKEKKTVYNGFYNDEETAARASDTLSKKLMANGEQNHKLNFPDDDTEVYA